jgi:Sulfotransferase family
MSPPRPNLFLIGAMKSGTTYLSELLGAHPQIFMSSPKEPCYFVDPKVLLKVWPGQWDQGYWRSPERYLSLFAAAGEAAVIGEASTVYSQVPTFLEVPERILAFNRQARFVYIMRDPVQRTISHYWHTVRYWGERRPMLEAIRADEHYREVSHYARQLKAYLRHVGRERVYVLIQERLRADPAGELSRLYAWLGVDRAFRPPRLGVPNNVLPPVIHQARGFSFVDRCRRTTMYRQLAPYIPRAVRDFGLLLMPTRRVRPADVDTSAVEAFLRPEQQRQTEELGRLLNRTFPEWRTLYAQRDAPTPAVAAALSRSPAA